MLSEQQFDSIVGGIYSAATGATTWSSALVPIHVAFGTMTTVMQSIDLQSGRLLNLAHSGPPMQAAVLDYLREWHLRDPRRAHLLDHPELIVDRWWHCHEHFDAGFVAVDPFYQDFLPAHDSRFLATTATLVTPTLLTSFSLELPSSRGPLTRDERHLIERLGRHVADALRAHERMRCIAAKALAGHGLLDAFTYPMWLLDQDRHVLFANGAAREQGAVVAALADGQSGRLGLCSDAADRALGLHLHAFGHGRHGMRAKIDIRRLPSDPVCWLHLQALEPQRTLGAFGNRPLVLATLFNPRQMRGLDPWAIGDLFGMTPTQARVASLLAEGLAADAMAAKLGCSTATVRSHLRAVMAKLGAGRLADAVRLLRQGEALWALPAGTTSASAEAELRLPSRH